MNESNTITLGASPELGDERVSVLNHSKNYVVQVWVFKFDTIRQESYWATKIWRVFKTKDRAEAYAKRRVSKA